MPDSPAARPGSLRRNAFANVVGRGVSAVMWLVVTPYALAKLGPERFAVWSLFFVFGGYLASLDMGMTSGVARYTALAVARQDHRNLISTLRRSLLLSGLVGLAWCVAVIVARGALVEAFHVPEPLRAEVSRSLIVFGFAMLAFAVTQVLNGALNGFQRLDLSNACFLSGLTLHTLVLFLGLWAGAGLMATAAAMASGHVLSAAMASRFVRKEVRGVPESEVSEPVRWRELLRFSGSVQATSAGAMGQLQTGKVVLGLLGKLIWVTEFELGFRVANAIWSLPTLIQGAVIPAAAHASVEGVARVRDVYEWASRWVFGLGGFVLAGLWLMAPALLTLWLGPGHESSIGVARWLAIALAIATVSGPATAVARGGGWPLLEAFNFAIALAINILICLWAVPRYGPQGACLAMGVSYGLAGAWLILTLHRILGENTVTWLVRTAAPRFLLPGVAAVILWRVWPGGVPAGKAEAILQLLLHGAAFTVLAVALSWPMGDARAVGRLVLARWRAVRSASGTESEVTLT